MTVAVPSQPRGRIYLLKDKNQVTRLEAMPYDSEDFLQGLLKDHPDLLAGEQINPDEPRRWLLVAREMGVPHDEGGGLWSIDLLFLDQDAMPTIVETKRSSNPGIHREVVGQMLDYAANATVHWLPGRIRSEFEARCEQHEDKPDEALRRSLGPKVDTEEFWRQVEANLQAKRIRMLFVADSIPSDLRRIVEFLNTSMDRAEVLAVELPRFAVDDQVDVVVPRLIGHTDETRHKKPLPPGPVGDGPYVEIPQKEFLDQACKHADSWGTVAAMKELVDWAEHRDLLRSFGRNQKRSRAKIHLPCKQDKVVCLIYMWSDGQSWLQMRNLKWRPPFNLDERRNELRDKLKRVQAFPAKANMEGEPPLKLSKISKDGQVEVLIEQLDWLVEQWRAE